MDDVRVYTGTLVADLRLPWAASLKQRRQVLRSVVDRLRRDEFSVAQVGPAQLRQRVFLAITAVSGHPGKLARRLDAAERILYASEFEVGAIHRDSTSWTGPSLP